MVPRRGLARLRHEDRREHRRRRAGTRRSPTAARPPSRPTASRSRSTTRTRTSGHTLAVMDYDNATKTFSNLVDIATRPERLPRVARVHAGPQWVVYHAGSSPRSRPTAARRATSTPSISRRTRRTASTRSTATRAARRTCPANDPKLSFAPTVLPEAVGGYFWVVFTSHRSYGNMLPSQDNGDEYGKLWVAAFDIDAAPGTDPSHPAFFLDGQEHAGRQPARLLGARPVQGERPRLRHRRRVLRRLLPQRRRRRPARVRPAPGRLLTRVREVHHRRRLLRLRSASASTASAPSS